LAIALSSIADAVIFRPLPVARADEIVRIFSTSPLHSLGFVSYPDYRDIARGTRTLSSVAAQTQVLLAVGAGNTELRMRMGLAVNAHYFDALGVRMHAGRSFHEDENRHAVVVLSHSFWQRQYNADAAMVGRTIFLAHAPFTVIGIAPAGFGLDRFLHEDFYVPLGVYAAGLLPVTGRPWEDRGRRYLSLYARRSAPLAAVQAELGSLTAQFAREFPVTNRQQKLIDMTDLDARIASAGGLHTAAWVLLSLALLSVCAASSNVCGLLLLRAEARAGEYALKVALGASAARLLREAFTESWALTAIGTATAIPLAWAGLKAAQRLWEMPTDLAVHMDARIDGRMALIAVAGACVTILLCTAVPAYAAQRESVPLTALRYAVRSPLRSVLVVVQVALAAALLGSGASLLASMLSASRADLGYRTDHILTMTFDPSQTLADKTHTRAFYRALLDRTALLPGVRQTALAQFLPLGFTAAQKRVKIAALDSVAVWMNTITPGYFDLMRMPLIAGRDFNTHDTDGTAPVAVVNEALARYWPDGRALGEIMEVDGLRTEVVGVVETAKYQQISEAPRPFFYLPYEQNFVPRMTLHIRTLGAPAASTPSVLAAAREIDPAQPVSEIRPFEQFLSHGALFTARIGVTVTAVAGGCIWVLSLTGLYACIASAIHRREREIGIRRALGARRWSIAGLVLTHGAKLTLAGIGIGWMLAAAGQRWTGQMIQQNGMGNWAGPAAASAVAAIASLAACFLPAWRASRGHPAIALRRI
jgi:predicted permease